MNCRNMISFGLQLTRETMKIILLSVAALIIIVTIVACGRRGDTDGEIVVGGLYASKSEDGTFRISKSWPLTNQPFTCASTKTSFLLRLRILTPLYFPSEGSAILRGLGLA